MNLSFVVVVVSVALSAADVAHAKMETAELPGRADQEERQDKNEVREKKDACDCCSQCLEAQRVIRGKEEGPPALDGCRDCCSRCGSDQLLKRKTPPEIVK